MTPYDDVIAKAWRKVGGIAQGRPTPYPALALRVLGDADRALGCFLRVDGEDPDRLTMRIGWLRKAMASIARACEIENLLMSDGDLQSACEGIAATYADLWNLNDFYRKNESRCSKVTLFSKSLFDADFDPELHFRKPKDRYQWSKQMFHLDLKRRGSSLLDRDLGDHLKAYDNWYSHNTTKEERNNHTTAYLATKFLLTKGYALERKKAPSTTTAWQGLYPKANSNNRPWDRGPSVEHGDIRLVFEDGTVKAWYQIERGRSSYVAYPGGERSGDWWTCTQLHTLGTKRTVDGKDTKFRARPRRVLKLYDGEGELQRSLKYAMRHDEIYIDPNTHHEDSFHSYSIDEKSAQAAGALVAADGKIVLIDNQSGHYYPGWRLLNQAVERIGTAFAHTAAVGVFSKSRGRAWFFPLATFRALVKKGFDPEFVRKMIAATPKSAMPHGLDHDLHKQVLKMWPSEQTPENVDKYVADIREF